MNRRYNRFLRSTFTSILCSALLLNIQLRSEESEFFTVQKRNVTHKFAKMGNEGPDSFVQLSFSEWENDTFDAFDQVKDPNGIAIDLGAWIGTTCIWLSHHFSYVVAVEADKLSVVYLQKNIEASGCNNVAICDKAISQSGGDVIFGPRLERIDKLNDSTSCIKKIANAFDSKNNYVISSLTLSQIIDDYIPKNMSANSKVRFIKCDIEGGEEPILEDILQYALMNNCNVWMSFHYHWWTEKNIDKFEGLFSQFDTSCPSKNICDYIKENPSTTILFKTR